MLSSTARKIFRNGPISSDPLEGGLVHGCEWEDGMPASLADLQILAVALVIEG
jgi:hypothetical protein